MKFFNGFSFDTLLAIISCITGIVALFVGGKAYKNSQSFEKSLNDDKKFEKNSNDYSQKAAGDIINMGINDKQLTTITTALSTMNSFNFSQALNLVYSKFQEQCEDNLAKIIEKTNEIISESKLSIASYTKLDWINIYFESAKNSSDIFMQDVWARVLATELSHPDSFSYKTLDVLKSMTADDYRLFEKLCDLEIDGVILHKQSIYEKYGLRYIELFKLKELGLLNMDDNCGNTYTLVGKTTANMTYNDILFRINNTNSDDVKVDVLVYLLTAVANELKAIVPKKANKEYAIDFSNELHKLNSSIKVELHRINTIVNGTINYQEDALYTVG